VVHPAPRTVLESVADKENIPVASAERAPVLKPSSTSDSVKANAITGKRLSTTSSNDAPSRKSKVAKTAPKKKVVPLQKGQKKLSAFFHA